MKKLFYLFNTLLLTATLAACSSDYDDPPEQPNSHQNEVSVDSVDSTQDEGASKDYTVISTVPVSEEVKAFFDEALPYLPDLPIELSPFSFQANANSDFFVINNEKELQNIYKGEKTLPQLDFENNTLIIGQLPMSGGSFLEAIYIRVYGDGNVLTIQTWEPPYQYSALYHMFFWGIFPKMLEEIDNKILWLNTKM
jgi:hypothetical protein